MPNPVLSGLDFFIPNRGIRVSFSQGYWEAHMHSYKQSFYHTAGHMGGPLILAITIVDVRVATKRRQ